MVLDDHNRVVLQKIPGQTNCYNDYINASHVDVSWVHNGGQLPPLIPQ